MEAPLTDQKKQLLDRVKAMHSTARQRVAGNPQLPLWPESVRSLPNEIVRSALFSAKNRRQPRVMLRQAEIAVIGDGRMIYTGDELRQDDETVWLQLIHLAKNQKLGELIEFTPYSFCKSMKWSISGQSYKHLRDVLTRLQATALQVYSKRLGEGVSISMIPFFTWHNEEGESLKHWRVRVAQDLVVLFGDIHFTRVEWEQRLSLPDGLATWLHGYFASHRTPYPVKIETIRKGAGLSEGSKAELRKTIKRALESLKTVKFLCGYKISDDLVSIERTKKESIDF
ncbi:MAG: plasmid replication initiator TrfA [Deltaproteobacteria bacterium]|nr:plasmid replication initiator TrfA [Deltaproteobacteria bacterium]